MSHSMPSTQPAEHNMALNSDIASLSLEEPAETLHSLIRMHQNIANVLKKAEATQGSASPEFPSAAHHFQHITNCKRSEALYCLNHVPNGDLRSAVLVWHSQVLKDYVASYQAPASARAKTQQTDKATEQKQQLPPSFKEHEAKEKAEAMRVKARKAASAADSYEMKDLAQDYLRTNFCSICKVEKDVATAYMEATKYDIVAAVEEYVARHLLHPSQSQNPDAGVLQHKVLLTRKSIPDSDSQGRQRASSSSSSTSVSNGKVPTAASSLSPQAESPPAPQSAVPQPAVPNLLASSVTVPASSPPAAAVGPAAPAAAPAGHPAPLLQPAAGLQYPTMKAPQHATTAKPSAQHPATSNTTAQSHTTQQSLQGGPSLHAAHGMPMQPPTQPTGGSPAPPAAAGLWGQVQPGLSPTSSVQLQYPMIGGSGGGGIGPSASVGHAAASSVNAGYHGHHSMQGTVQGAVQQQHAAYPAISKPGLPHAPSQPGDLRRKFGQRH